MDIDWQENEYVNTCYFVSFTLLDVNLLFNGQNFMIKFIWHRISDYVKRFCIEGRFQSIQTFTAYDQRKEKEYFRKKKSFQAIGYSFIDIVVFTFHIKAQCIIFLHR